MSVVDEYASGWPSARLRPHVAFYSGYRQRGIAPGLHRGLPSPHLTLIFTMDEPLIVDAHPDPRQRAGSYDALIGGLHLGPAIIRHEGRQSGVQVALRPLGCRALLGVPAGELSSLDVPASAVLDAALIAEIRERLSAAGSWPERFAVVDGALCRRMGTREVVRPEVAYAWKRLVTGHVSVTAVAAEVGWSGRHLTDRFRAEVGLRPKEAARVARFDRARRALRPGTRFADLASGFGFFDQSHLVREFHALAGCAPSEWLADEFGFVQAMAGAAAHHERYD
ncbi:AraC family transcriptional regulator [Paractinoplanes atraurantiacus]|uniref:Helix-turn-helix domain-containing protein n=1 Tax=Paractinoplanes atraurantiacus TaxID=1036182 RepID=A0A285JII3_9ACTN|nr:helix-turn-helix domain-containing protein [Actinoplanes atraurantiacus]SNY60075.1 Helix-turn-helix domain-containing protein [Actinoplanes atraurantiacus]